MTTKICKKCGVEKPLDEFSKDKKNKKDGRTSWCKECTKEYRKQYNKQNKEKINAKNKEWYENNKERKLKQNKEWKENNKEKYKELQKEWYENNKEHKNKKSKEWYENNKEYANELTKEWYENNKEYHKTLQKEWVKNNKEKVKLSRNTRKAKLLELPYTLTNEEWNETKVLFNDKCALGGKGKINLEHFIPISIGHGGTTKANCYPMEERLNFSKGNKNPFKWVQTQPEKIKKEFYNKLVPYLAEQNDMTVDEFKKYVKWCFANPRTLEQIKSDNEKGLTSIDIFKNKIKTEVM